jgi:EamA-like transporter family.
LIATVIAYYFWVKALATYKAANVAPFTLLIPIIGLILGNLLFAEALGGLRLIGSVVIITGILIHMVGIRIEEARSRKYS